MLENRSSARVHTGTNFGKTRAGVLKMDQLKEKKDKEAEAENIRTVKGVEN